MHLLVTDLLGRPGASRRVATAVTRAELDDPAGAWGPGDDALASDLDLDLTLEMLLEGLLARGTVGFRTLQPCARCLVEVTTALDVTVAEMYAQPHRGEEPEEGYEIAPEGTISLDTLLRETVVTNVPLRVLCRDECRGLCVVCDADLNINECGHRQTAAPDPRWAALERLRTPTE